jgi:hypothetical protein
MIKEIVDPMKIMYNRISIAEFSRTLITQHFKQIMIQTTRISSASKSYQTGYQRLQLDTQKLVYLNYSKLKTNKLCILLSIQTLMYLLL